MPSAPAAPSDYPARWESDVLLADGGTAHVRPIRPDDEGGLIDLHSRLSAESQYLRFFSAMPRLSPELARKFTNLDYADRMALVAELDGRLVGVARYDRVGGTDDADAAFTVADEQQGRGIGTILLEHLAAAAREHGIARFVADVLPQNAKMLNVFRRAGFAERAALEAGVVSVTLDLIDSDRSLDAARERERVATVRSIERLLRPHSVAVVGAGSTPGRVGHEVFRNLLSGGFDGPVYPVNAKAAHVGSVRAYPSVLDIPDPVDLAVIAVPAEDVAAVVDECGAKGVHALVIVSAGFAETGTEGAARQADVVRRARGHGMRVVGPNCIGILNTSGAVGLNATFAEGRPQPGVLGLMSQSGGVGVAVLNEAAARGLGVSSFVSVGNKADVSGNDLIQYWEEDDATAVVLLYLESFGNPRKFGRIARRVSRTKPIVAVKSGRSAAGARGGASHTAALASPDAAVDALFRQSGVIRVDDLDDLFGTAQVLASQPLPTGRRVAVLTNAGGPGILAADACARAGLEVPELPAAVQQALLDVAPAAAGVGNPIDLIAAATPEQFAGAIAVLGAASAVDAVLVVYVPSLVGRPDEVADAIATAAASGCAKPVVASFLGSPAPPAALGDVPAFAYPEAAARALAHAADYGAWRARPDGAEPELPGFDGQAARAVVQADLQARPEGGWLDPELAQAVLDACAIPSAAVVVVDSAESAAAAAQRGGRPVVLKAVGPTILHKSDVGGVALDLATPAAAARAYTDMAERLGEAMTGAVVQPMAGRGVEMIVGVVQDPSFGPLVMLGTGGTAVEVMGDRAFRILPVTDLDARELVDSIRGARLLAGVRGGPASDRASLEDVVMRVARLADEVPELRELDLNPVVVSADGAVAVDVRMRVEAVEAHPELGVRRLR
jgi:acetyl coenzyme A synthetase (ADP forming)-like protein